MATLCIQVSDASSFVQAGTTRYVFSGYRDAITDSARREIFLVDADDISNPFVLAVFALTADQAKREGCTLILEGSDSDGKFLTKRATLKRPFFEDVDSDTGALGMARLRIV